MDRHASGVLTGVEEEPVPDGLTLWPPRQARVVPVEGVYQQLAGYGYGYGPVFQGLRAVWRDGDSIYAEVCLPEQVEADGLAFIRRCWTRRCMLSVWVGGLMAVRPGCRLYGAECGSMPAGRVVCECVLPWPMIGGGEYV